MRVENLAPQETELNLTSSKISSNLSGINLFICSKLMLSTSRIFEALFRSKITALWILYIQSFKC